MKKCCALLLTMILLVCCTNTASARQSVPLTDYVSRQMEYNLDSEAQSASDLAEYFGYSVSPLEILEKLPQTDDPNTGYVGYYDDEEAGLPPKSYGVYQTPLAEVLNTFDIPAQGYEDLTIEALHSYLDSGFPVICWVVANTISGKGVDYTPKDGEKTVVVMNMNTVTLSGYDNNQFTIWDNGKSYTRSFIDFETSWKVLGHRALVIHGQPKPTPIIPLPTEAAPTTDASAAVNWWNQSMDDYWKADQAWKESTGTGTGTGTGTISLQNLPADVSAEAFFKLQSDPNNGGSFGTVPEVAPSFDLSSIPNPEDYKGWFWYPDADNTSTGNSFIPYSGTFGNYSGSWDPNLPLPAQALIDGFVGHAQSYNLDCETRSAVDLAAFFGFNINAQQFLDNLPKSDDPNEGFVGNYTDERGQIPPASYGVYQEPVASQLRAYGFPAVGYKDMSFEQVKYEIASGRPVMVWVAGATETSTALPYTPASNGRTTYVAPFQHTVVILGYDSLNVTIQDGGMRYTRNINTFLASWRVLENRGIVAVY